MTEFGPVDLGSDIGPDGNFIKKTPEVVQQPPNPEVESDEYGEMKELFTGGSVDEYVDNVGAISPEGIREPLGDDRTFDQFSSQERSETISLISDYATQRGLAIDAGDDYYIARAA